jgi:hypothetical protein
VNQGSIFAATTRIAELPTPSDQAGVRVLDARIAGIVSPNSLLQTKKQRQRHTHHFANTAALAVIQKAVGIMLVATSGHSSPSSDLFIVYDFANAAQRLKSSLS